MLCILRQTCQVNIIRNLDSRGTVTLIIVPIPGKASEMIVQVTCFSTIDAAHDNIFNPNMYTAMQIKVQAVMTYVGC